MARILTLALLATLGGAACSSTADAGTSTASALTTALGQKLVDKGAVECASNREFLCFRSTSRIDHFSGSSADIEVVFAVRPAPDASRRGTLVIALEDSGVELANTLANVDGRFAEELDLVYFDARGVGLSRKLDCPNASAALRAASFRIDDDASEDDVVARARAFAEACPRETSERWNLKLYSTVQAAEDLEDFRRVIGEDKLSLYGAGAGTRLIQKYAQKHPEHVRLLALDGAVDTTLNQIDHAKSMKRGAEDVLVKAIAACAASAECAAKFASGQGDSAETKIASTYDHVIADLEAGPKTVEVTAADGAKTTKAFTRADLDSTTVAALGSADHRRDLLTALAAAKAQDFAPFVALAAAVTSKRVDAVRYAYACNDFGSNAATAAERSAIYLTAGRPLWNESRRLLSPYYEDLPCVHWPDAPPALRREPVKAEGIPSLVLASTGDTRVPLEQSEAVASQLASSSTVTVDGGGHVTFARGNACVDKTVAEFILDGKAPENRAQRCPDTFVSP